jgi:hypothetical protein
MGTCVSWVVAAASAAALAYGTVVHVVQWATSGLRAYPDLPWWLAGYFTLLTFVDPIASVLLWRCRRSGLVLGSLVLVTDAAANAYANYALDDSLGLTPGRIGQAVISILAVALLTATPWLWPTARRDEPPPDS